MSCGERFTYNDVMEQRFDGDIDIDENVSETEEDPDFGVFSSDKNERPPYMQTSMLKSWELFIMPSIQCHVWKRGVLWGQ